MPSEPFDLAALDAAVAGSAFAGRITHLPTTLSTNSVALKAALGGERWGVWIADQQLAGRGRGAHTWHSPAGDGLYLSALAAPPIPMQSVLQLSFRAAIAAQSAIASLCGFRVPGEIDIRWPNDLILNRRKVGGILIDTASNPATPTQPATLRYAIIGIGINVNHSAFPPSLDAIATSLRRELPDPPALPRDGFPHAANSTTCLRREPLAAAILLALDRELRALAAGSPQPASCACSDPTACSSWIAGKRVRVESRDGTPSYTGTTAGLNPQGFLLVHGDDGQLHTVLSGGLREMQVDR